MSPISLQNSLNTPWHTLCKSLAEISGDVQTPDPLDFLLHHGHTGASLLLQLVLEHSPEVLYVVEIRGVARSLDHINCKTKIKRKKFGQHYKSEEKRTI